MKHPYYDVTQAACMLGTTAEQIRRACENGAVPNSFATQKGTNWRVSREDIKAYFECSEAFKKAFGLPEETK